MKVVRRVRDDIAVLLELAEKAEERGCGDEADRVLDAFFDERIDYEEALERLKKLANR